MAENVRIIPPQVSPPAKVVPIAPPPVPSSAPVAPVVRRRRFGKGWVVGLLVLVLLAGAAATWWAMQGAANVSYTTAPVTRGTVARTVTATGTVNPVLTIIVGTYVSGVIQKLQCDYNTQVKQGQICAKIDPRPYQTVVDQARANLAEARAQLEKDKAGLAYAKTTYERQARLAETHAVSKDAADNAKNVYDQAQAQIDLDQAIIDQRKAQLASAEVNLGYTDIVSPVDGTVVSRNVTMGQTVAASFQTPTLFLIATDLTQMQVDSNVSESDIGGVKEGNKARFTVDAFPKRTFEGVVTQVRQSPQTVQNVVTYDVVVGVNNSDLALKPGMTTATRIVTAQRDGVLRVPNQAIRYRPASATPARERPARADGDPAQAGAIDRARVWVLRDGKPTRVTVVTGLDDDDFTEIVSGELKADDRVIVAEQRQASGTRRVPVPKL